MEECVCVCVCVRVCVFACAKCASNVDCRIERDCVSTRALHANQVFVGVFDANLAR
jgi:hypothetical protein